MGKVVKRNWEATYQTVLYALRNVPGTLRREYLLREFQVSGKGLGSIRNKLRGMGYDVTAWQEAAEDEAQNKRSSRDWPSTYAICMACVRSLPKGSVHRAIADSLGVSPNTMTTIRSKLELYGYDVSEWYSLMGVASKAALPEVLQADKVTDNEDEDEDDDDYEPFVFSLSKAPVALVSMVQPLARLPAQASRRTAIPWSFASLVELSGLKPTTVALACRIERVKRYRGHYTMLTEDEASRVLFRIGVDRV